MDRQITLLIPGGANGDVRRDVNIPQGMTVNAFLQGQNLNGYQLSTGAGHPLLAGTDDLFKQVDTDSATKVYATTPATQG